MALDGFFLNAYIKHLNHELQGSKIEKIYQINSDLMIHFRGGKNGKLRLSADATHPRVLLTDEKVESPENPPMFCMLLRKHLTGGIIQHITQEGLERILVFSILARNDFGDKVEKKLIIEIMGKHSNIILVGDSQRVIDSIKRVNPHMSPRPIGPGTTYGPPPTTKLSLDSLNPDQWSAITTPINKGLYGLYEGVSPSLANSILAFAGIDGKTPMNLLDPTTTLKLIESIHTHRQALDQGVAYLYKARDTQAIQDFSAVPLYHLLNQQGRYIETTYTDYDNLLALVYARTNDNNRIVQKSSHLMKLITLLQDRLSAKIANLENDRLAAANLDTFKLYGELLTANLHALKKGMADVSVLNYYSGETVTIPLDVTKTPNENAQRYYKRYNKAKTTLEEAKGFIEQAQDELNYLEAVRISLLQAELVEDVDAIKEELAEQGFIKAATLRKQKRLKKIPPYHYISSEGVSILVGRNNVQNDQLTLKDSHKDHIWLHTKDVPGSHVIIQATFPEIDDATVVEAAEIAAYHSKARLSSQVAVDFTEVKFVKKPKGAKPGMVIYDDFKTIYVTPQADKITALRKKTTT